MGKERFLGLIYTREGVNYWEGRGATREKLGAVNRMAIRRRKIAEGMSDPKMRKVATIINIAIDTVALRVLRKETTKD